MSATAIAIEANKALAAGKRVLVLAQTFKAAPIEVKTIRAMGDDLLVVEWESLNGLSRALIPIRALMGVQIDER
jgi:hypothetical protein